MPGESNGAASNPPLQQLLIESDGLSVRIKQNVPNDVAEGLLARALAHVGREILRAQLAEDARPKVEVFPSAAGLPPRGLV